jgi:hypothetical protein
MISPEGRIIPNFHTAVVTFLVFGFNRRIRPEDLQFRYSEIPENEIRNMEARLLADYVMMYLDKPPLNTSVKR